MVIALIEKSHFIVKFESLFSGKVSSYSFEASNMYLYYLQIDYIYIS